MYQLLRFIPKNHLSYIVGVLVGMPLPGLIARPLIHLYAFLYKIDLTVVRKPLKEFRSLQDFFTRDLKDNVRPIATGLVSPVDGTMRAAGAISAGNIPQVKGVEYSVESLLASAVDARQFKGGFYYSLYLSPRDYHHVHAPIGGVIRRFRYIPGKLWPVNDWSIENINGLFSVNERVVIYIDSSLGEIAVVMVGATNVGKISLTFDNVTTNCWRWPWNRAEQPLERSFADGGVPVQAGERLGTFHLGSSVVLLLPGAGADASNTIVTPGPIHYGEQLQG